VTQKWETIETRGHKPSPRSGHTMTLNDSSDTQMYLFGGACGQWGTFNDFYSFDISTRRKIISCSMNHFLMIDLLGNNTWAKISMGGDIPTPRFSHTTTFYRDNLLVFGGSGDKLQSTAKSSAFDDVSILDLSKSCRELYHYCTLTPYSLQHVEEM
jgi:hypothetical protein